jgi:hypothetical protein
MSISGLSSTNFFQSLYAPNSQNQQSPRAKFAQEFQQLGQDLQSGNLSQAQSDFATLTANTPFAQSNQTLTGQTATATTGTTNGTTTATTTNPIAQTFTQLSQDLQAGNLSAAQSDYSTIQQDFQQQAAAVANHPHHHHHGSGSANSSSSQQGTNSSSSTAGSTSSATTGTSLDQTILALGQALQSGSLSNAQQSYTSLLQALNQNGATSGSGTSASSGIEGSLIQATTATQLLNFTA